MNKYIHTIYYMPGHPLAVFLYPKLFNAHNNQNSWGYYLHFINETIKTQRSSGFYTSLSHIFPDDLPYSRELCDMQALQRWDSEEAQPAGMSQSCGPERSSQAHLPLFSHL